MAMNKPGRRVGTPTQHNLNTCRGESSRSPIATGELKKRVVDININRKLMTHGIIEQFRDTAKGKDMLAGSAVMELLNEYDRMRYLMEGLVTSYERDDEAKVRKILEILRIIL
jgi:hypothetical protein